MKFVRKVLARVRKADHTFNLINEGDRICVGISGGKDSSVLLYSLIFYKMYAKVDFEIVPIILDLGFEKFDPIPLIQFFRQFKVEIIVEDAKSIYPILKANQDDDKHLPCSICSRMKKAAINQAAHKNGCNKVSFGHHYDDAIETMFLNVVYGGRLATFAPKMHLDREDIVFIRPLALAREEEIIKACRELNMPIIDSGCPANKMTKREDVKNDLKSMYKRYNQSSQNIESILTNDTKSDIWFDKQQIKITGEFYLEKVVNLEQGITLSSEYQNETKSKLIFHDSYYYFLIKKDEAVLGTLIFELNNHLYKEIYLSKKYLGLRESIYIALKDFYNLIG